DFGDRRSLPPISSPIVNAQEITKAFGANPLFQNVSFTISDGDRIGLIGPNGSGKSTLLRILAADVAPDSGEVSFRKRTRLACVEQDSIQARSHGAIGDRKRSRWLRRLRIRAWRPLCR